MKMLNPKLELVQRKLHACKVIIPLLLREVTQTTAFTHLLRNANVQ